MRRSPGRYDPVPRSNLIREKPTSSAKTIARSNVSGARTTSPPSASVSASQNAHSRKVPSPASRPSQRENGGPARSQHRALSEDPRCNKADCRRRRRSNRKTTGLRTDRRQPTTRSALYSMLARALPIQSKRQRVAPFGSLVATATALWGVIAYRYQGGGAGARSTVWCCQYAITCARRPTLRGIAPGEQCQRGSVCHSNCVPFDHQIDVRQRH
jgi:hypothetical protein